MTTYRPRIKTKNFVNYASKEVERPTFYHSNIVSDASGSMYLEVGNTKVLASLYGPRAKQIGASQYKDEGVLNCEFKYSPFANKNNCNVDFKASNTKLNEKSISDIIKNALEPSIQLEKYPKSVFDLYIYVIQDDGSVIASAINCSSMAFATAGIELYDLVCSCSVVRCLVPNSANEYELLVDPNSEQEETADSIIYVALMPSLQQITQVELYGNTSFENAGNAITTALTGCTSTNLLMRRELIKRFS